MWIQCYQRYVSARYVENFECSSEMLGVLLLLTPNHDIIEMVCYS